MRRRVCLVPATIYETRYGIGGELSVPSDVLPFLSRSFVVCPLSNFRSSRGAFLSLFSRLVRPCVVWPDAATLSPSSSPSPSISVQEKKRATCCCLASPFTPPTHSSHARKDSSAVASRPIHSAQPIKGIDEKLCFLLRRRGDAAFLPSLLGFDIAKSVCIIFPTSNQLSPPTRPPSLPSLILPSLPPSQGEGCPSLFQR